MYIYQCFLTWHILLLCATSHHFCFKPSTRFAIGDRTITNHKQLWARECRPFNIYSKTISTGQHWLICRVHVDDNSNRSQYGTAKDEMSRQTVFLKQRYLFLYDWFGAFWFHTYKYVRIVLIFFVYKFTVGVQHYSADFSSAMIIITDVCIYYCVLFCLDFFFFLTFSKPLKTSIFFPCLLL